MQNYTQLFSVYKWSYDAVSGSREKTGLLKEMLAQVIISEMFIQLSKPEFVVLLQWISS